eukprot:2490739-Amphidinium_carterae.1
MMLETCSSKGRKVANGKLKSRQKCRRKLAVDSLGLKLELSSQMALLRMQTWRCPLEAMQVIFLVSDSSTVPFKR